MIVTRLVASGATDTILYASHGGAHLDTDLIKGGGTDDTAVLQALLDRAKDGSPVHLIIDGPSLVSGLNAYGNTTIEFTAGAGLYLKDNSSRAIIRNADRSRGAITDEHIEIRGGFLNGNRKNQPSANISRADLPGDKNPSNKEPDGTYMGGLQFLGVNYLNIHDVTLWNVRAFSICLANASYVDVRNVIIDHGGGPNAKTEDYLNSDGLHFKGPLRNVSIDTVKIRVGDDCLAFNANDYDTNDVTTRNDFGPYVGQGPITDVTVNNVQLLSPTTGIRILSTNERIDRIVITNVVGMVSKDFYLLNIGHWMNPGSFGNIGRITIDHVSVDRPEGSPVKPELIEWVRKNSLWNGEANGGLRPLINIDARVESLRLHDIATHVADNRPLLRVGAEAAVGLMDVDLSVYDPKLMGSILQLDKNGQVGQLKMALSWQGAVPDEGKNPIDDQGGIIGSLQWVGTPPMYMEARVVAGDSANIDVAFNQQLKARLSAAGAKVVVNGNPVNVVGAVLLPDGKTIRYKLASPIKPADEALWSYDAAAGDVQNMSGSSLGQVSGKRVHFER
jgi:hypothetical protein